MKRADQLDALVLAIRWDEALLSFEEPGTPDCLAEWLFLDHPVHSACMP